MIFETEEYRWLIRNSIFYGFIQRNPEKVDLPKQERHSRAWPFPLCGSRPRKDHAPIGDVFGRIYDICVSSNTLVRNFTRIGNDFKFILAIP